MTALPDFRLERHFAKWEFTARFNLAASDAQPLKLAKLLALASDQDRAGFEEMDLGYTPTFGAADLRAAIAATYEQREADDILCFAGAQEGLYAAMQILLGAGDHAIVMTPNYQSAETVPLSLCAISGVPLEPSQNWSLDIDRVAAAIRPQTKLVSINFPHNPTGKILERDRFDALVALCRRHGLWLFSDEVYRPLGPEGAVHLPQAADVYERGISLGVMSKVYGLAGLRIGWLACGDRDFLQRCDGFKHYLSICNAVPSERLALIALKAREHILARNRAIIEANLAALDAFFAAHPGLFEWVRPDGGCVGFPRYLGKDGADAFAKKLVEQAGVLVLPSGIYHSELGPTPGDRVRIGFGRKDLPLGLAALHQYLETLS